jgi:thiol-disulfide isomerase/thioredoxin
MFDGCMYCMSASSNVLHFWTELFPPCNRYSIDEVSQVYVSLLIHVHNEYVMKDLSFLTENVVNDDPDESEICSTQATNRTFDQRNTFIVFHTYCII